MAAAQSAVVTASFVPVPGLRFELRVNAVKRKITLDGELDVAAAGDLARAVVTLQRAGPGDITVRLDGVVFMDMAGLGSIVGARNAQAERQSALVITGATGMVRRLFDLSGLGALLATEIVDAETR